MKIYVVGSSKNKFLPLDNIREKFLIDQPHEGDNIDFLNPWYCELTGLYYLWKHVDDDIIGLEHYRRYFVNNKGNLLSEGEIREILKDYDVICRKCIMPARFKTLWKSLTAEHKTYLLKFLSLLPEDIRNFIFNRIQTSLFFEQCNMMICNKDIVDKYFSWFLEYACQFTSKDFYRHKRIFGYISEFIFGSWLLFNNYKISYQTVKTFNIDLNKIIEIF